MLQRRGRGMRGVGFGEGRTACTGSVVIERIAASFLCFGSWGMIVMMLCKTGMMGVTVQGQVYGDLQW